MIKALSDVELTHSWLLITATSNAVMEGDFYDDAMNRLTLLYDGGCPLCLLEVRFLEQRDQRLHPQAPRRAFVDIDAAD